MKAPDWTQRADEGCFSLSIAVTENSPVLVCPSFWFQVPGDSVVLLFSDLLVSVPVRSPQFPRQHAVVFFPSMSEVLMSLAELLSNHIKHAR